MDYYSYNEIADQFMAFIKELGIEPYEDFYFIADGSLHRFRTTDDKGGREAGAYVLHTDNIPSGYVQDWRKQIKATWSMKVENDKRKFNVKAFNKEAQKRQQQREKELQDKYNKAAELARIHFEALPDSSIHSHDKNFHPYVKAKNIYPWNARLNNDTNALTIPLRDIDGNIKSLQWISADGQKRFYPGATTKGAFCNIYDSGIYEDSVILIGEGFATMSKVYELTHLPCIAAMSAGNLQPVAEAFRKKYPNNKIFITADNDIATEKKAGYNPGLDAANELVDLKLADAVIAPELLKDIDDDCSDWNDYASKYGDDKARARLDHFIQWWSLSQDERNEIETELASKKVLLPLLDNLDPTVQLQQQEFVGGIFPRKFVSIVAAAPGTGKTMLMQRLVSDLSLGGTILGGVTEHEPVRKCLIFAGEAGWELLTRRGASLKWEINPENVKVVDQYKYESKGQTVMLHEKEGWYNTKIIIKSVNPDIVFWDTFSSFHEKDENKATEIKPLIMQIANFAREKNFAAVLNHHSRKRLTKERNLALTQDDVIGSSIFNRLAALIIGIEKDEDELDGAGKVLKVRPLKTWFGAFKSFNFTLEEGYYGGTVMNIDTNPKDVNNSRNAFWTYLVDTFKQGEWFSAGDIELSVISPNITIWQVRKYLAEFSNTGKLNKQGSTKTTQYSLP